MSLKATGRGSNQVDEDFDRDEKKFHPRIESCTFRNGKGDEREAAEILETKRAIAMSKPILNMIDQILRPVKKAKQK